MENSARQPLSTQIPRWLRPQLCPLMHGLSLIWRTSVTPPSTLSWHWCRVLLSDSQTTSVSFVVVAGTARVTVVVVVMVSVDGVIRNSARHPRSTQITLSRYPPRCPPTHPPSLLLPH